MRISPKPVCWLIAVTCVVKLTLLNQAILTASPRSGHEKSQVFKRSVLTGSSNTQENRRKMPFENPTNISNEIYKPLKNSFRKKKNWWQYNENPSQDCKSAPAGFVRSCALSGVNCSAPEVSLLLLLLLLPHPLPHRIYLEQPTSNQWNITCERQYTRALTPTKKKDSIYCICRFKWRKQ